MIQKEIARMVSSNHPFQTSNPTYVILHSSSQNFDELSSKSDTLDYMTVVSD